MATLLTGNPTQFRPEMAAKAELLRRDFTAFAREAWEVIEPGRKLIWGKPLDAICYHLQALADGKIPRRRLVINVPPRCSKSSLVTILWPAWLWTRQPLLETISASHSSSLSRDHSVSRRLLVTSPWYQQRFGDRVILDPNQMEKTDIANMAGGHLYAGSVHTGVTGKNSDVQIGDDLLDAMKAVSETELSAVNRFMRESLFNRANDRRTVMRVIVMQRLHTDDPTGQVMRQPGWCLLKLPMEYEGDDEPNLLGWRDWRSEPGELLWPERWGPEDLAEWKEDYDNPYAISGQLQQRPVPAEGGIFKAEWMQQRYDADGLTIDEIKDKMDLIILSVDSAFSEGVSSDYSVIAAWGRTGTDYYLLDLLRRRMEFDPLTQAIKEMAAKWEPSNLLIENKASGQSAAQTLKRNTGLPIWPVDVRASKEIRAEQVTGLFAAGKVWLPKTAPWLQDWITEHIAFTPPPRRYPHDDQCLLPTMALPALAHDDKLYATTSRREANMLVRSANEVVVGDHLLTHEGRWRPVLNVMTRDYDGDVVAIKPQGAQEMILTPEHPVLCVVNTLGHRQQPPRATGEPTWVHAEDVRPSDSVLEAIDQEVNAVESIDLADYIPDEWRTRERKNAAGVNVSGLLITDDKVGFRNPRSRPLNRIVTVDGDLCRLFGYYVAEGSRGKHNIAFSFHKDETDYVQDVRDIIERKFGVSVGPPSINEKDNVALVSLSSLILHSLFGQFGRGARNKRIPTWIMHLPTELQAEFIKGMWRGDGCPVTGGATNNPSYVYVTSSRSLAESLKMLLYRQGIVPNMAIGRPNGVEGTVIKDKTVRRSGALYHIRVSGEFVSQLAVLLGDEDRRAHIVQRRVSARIIDGYVHRRVKATRVEPYAGPVYNFEIDEDHTYQTTSFLVHNCDTTSMALGFLRKRRSVYGPVVLTSGGVPLLGEGKTA